MSTSQFYNPIRNKLTKMRSSKVQSNHSNENQNTTPLKTDERSNDYEKQNFSIHTMTLTQHSPRRKQEISQYNNYTFKSNKNLNESSLRKLSLLQRKNYQKEESNSFYLNEINRRKQKYEKQILLKEEEYESYLIFLQQKLMEQMKEEQELDEQTECLQSLLDLLKRYSFDTKEYKEILTELKDDYLNQLERQLIGVGCVDTGSLLYSKETTVLAEKNISQVENKSYYSTNKLTLSDLQEREVVGKKALNSERKHLRPRQDLPIRNCLQDVSNTLQRRYYENQIR